MLPIKPLANLPTHEVTNMPPYLGGQDLWMDDIALREGVAREGGSSVENRLSAFGKIAGSAEIFEKVGHAALNYMYNQPVQAWQSQCCCSTRRA